MMDKADSNLIKASPTKEFFISMLVKDIGLTRAILDLVDNSVDGAQRLRSKGRYDGLWARLTVDRHKFVIHDNCGGIPVSLARDYAFRFGRAGGTPTTKHSVGQFGVGMKRALFKLGSMFSVKSATATSRFTVTVDVDEWKVIDEPEWHFHFGTLEENTRVPKTGIGTTIEVTRLHGNVADDFGSDSFLARLRTDLEEAHTQNLNNGLAVTLNGVPVQVHPLELLQSANLKPAVKEIQCRPERGKQVAVRMYSGVAESSPSSAGWYIFCNGRMVLCADQTLVTGWGEGEESTIPKYHNQYARFRGYAFFDSDDAGLLPWNTTKTGVDTDSPVYRAVRLEMVRLMRPVLDFLNKLKDEKDRSTATGPLAKAVDAASAKGVAEVTGKPAFVAPKSVTPSRATRYQNIQYQVLTERVEKAKRSLKARSLKEVGERTFSYYFDRECE